jgi:hypothetical protein
LVVSFRNVSGALSLPTKVKLNLFQDDQENEKQERTGWSKPGEE